MPLPTSLHNHNSPATLNHPHPLRSHSSSENVLAPHEESLPTPTHSPTLSLVRPNSNDGQPHHPDRHDQQRSFHSSRGGPHRTSFHVLPSIPSLPSSKRRAAPEGLGDGAGAGAGVGEVPSVVIPPTRPPLRPTVSFSSVSEVSYYSADEPILEKDALRVTIEELGEEKVGGRCDWKFYGCFTCLCLLNFVCDLSTTALSTALPMISKDLNLSAVQTFWIPGSLLFSAALTQPLFMRLSVVLGCKFLLLLGIALFTAGSIVAATAPSLTLLLYGRSIEGVGVGAITVLSQLTLNQISRGQGHPAEHRRVFQRAASHLFWLGIALGPVIGGTCAETIGWRYVFWIQVPFGLLGLISLPVLLKLPLVETGPVGTRLTKIDFLGWLILSGSLASILIAVSWAGTQYEWSSYYVWVPLVIGLIGLPCWCLYSRYRVESILPVSIFRNASAAVACIGTFVHGIILAAIIYLMPLFLQVQGLSELVSGISLAPWTFSVVVLGLIGGVVQSLGGYRLLSWTGWGLSTLGLGLMIMFNDNTSAGFRASIGLIAGIALGVLLPGQTTAIESAASTDDETIHAVPLHLYLTTLGKCFGVLGGSSIFLNNLKSEMLSNPFLGSNFTSYIEHAVSMVKVIVESPSDEGGLQSNIITAYTAALRPVWITACVLAGLSFFFSIWFWEDHAPPRRLYLPESE